MFNVFMDKITTSPQNHLIILASASPRRQELLQALGLPIKVITPGHAVDETPLLDEAPAALVQRLSRLKAETVAESLSSPKDRPVIIIAADTVVALGEQILGKPANPTEAVAMLTQLRQQSHTVYSGLTVARLHGPKRTFITRLHQSAVWMRPYTNTEIAAYVASGDPLDKAGAYGIQHQTFNPVAHLEGCFASVMGLPLGELAIAFRQIGLSLPEISPLCARKFNYPCCQGN